MRQVSVAEHYDLLIDERDDPVKDPPALRAYMERWDGAPFIEALCPDRADEILEIGVGTGRLAARVAPLCGGFTGIDVSPKTIARAAENLAGLQNVTLVCGDFLQFPFEKKFSAVYSSLTFLHIRAKRKAMQKAANLLNDGGRFVLSVDKNAQKFLECGERRVRLYPDDPQKTEEYLIAAGFTVTETIQTDAACIFAAVKGTF